MTSGLKILELCRSADLGGLELYFEKTAKELAAHGAFCAVARNTRLEKRLPQASIKLSGFFLADLIRLWRFVRAHGVGLIHFHHRRDFAICVALKIVSAARLKLVYSRHMQIPAAKGGLHHRFMYARLDLMLVITKTLESEARRFLPESFSRDKIRVLYYGVKKIAPSAPREQVRVDLGLAIDDFVVGIFGRIEEQKGQFLLLEALSGTDLKGLIVGAAMNDDYLQALKQKAGANIIFKSFTPKVQDLMAACDLIVLATKNETFGLVVAEAMTLAVPVLVSNQGGALELVGENNERGLAFESMNAADLRAKILEVRTGADLARGRARAAQEFVAKELDYARHYERLAKILAGVLDTN